MLDLRQWDLNAHVGGPLCINRHRSVPFRELSRFLGPAGGLHLHGCRRTLIPRQAVRILLPGGFT